MEFRSLSKNSERLQKQQLLLHLSVVAVENKSYNVEDGVHFIVSNCSTAEFKQEGPNRMCLF